MSPSSPSPPLVLDAPPPPSFDVGDSIAALIVSHVTDWQTLAALTCTSRVWRRATTTTTTTTTALLPAATHDLERIVIEGAVARRLTDVRMSWLLVSFAGPRLKSLVVRDAPAPFTGKGLGFRHGRLYFYSHSTSSAPNLMLVGRKNRLSPREIRVFNWS